MLEAKDHTNHFADFMPFLSFMAEKRRQIAIKNYRMVEDFIMQVCNFSLFSRCVSPLKIK
jgi:hypothetical protein